MLTRTTQVGEFYVMRAPPFCPKPGATGFMDMFIFDEEGDRFVRIGWEEAIKASGMKALAADLSVAPAAKVVASTGFTKIDATDSIPTYTTAAKKDVSFRFTDGAGDEVDARAGTIAAWYGHAMWFSHYNKVGIPTDANEYEKFQEEYKKCAMNLFLVVCRPFIEHTMHSAIAMVGGRDTGATLFGPAGETP